MKAAEARFKFPVLGFTSDKEIWGFPDLNALTSCGPRTLKNNMQLGMELIDGDGRRCVVRSVRRLGRDRPLLPWLLSALLAGVPGSRIEHDLEDLEPVSLSEIKTRACASLEATSSDYCEDDEPEVLASLLAQVCSARSVGEIHDLLGLDSFMGY
jgi:hypothetical protein